MDKTLHIVNGDSTLGALEEIGISGEKVVFRDVLCEGPVRSDVGSDEYWKLRSSFMTHCFGPTQDEFKSYVIDEFDRLSNSDEYSEIVLWFEYDLFCQVNMLAIIAYLSSKSFEVPITLICSGKEENSEQLLGLGELPLERLTELFDERITLTRDDLTYARRLFQAYCGSNPRSITSLIDDNPRFPYLKGAFEAHMKRFPFKNSRFNVIEHQIIQFMDQGITEPREVVGKMLLWQKATYYGFGDSQYFNYLKTIQENKVINRDYQLGGTLVADFEWDDNKKELVSSGN